MKKTIFIILALMIMTLSACTDSLGKLHFNEIYQIIFSDGTVYKFNVTTGSVTPLCPDPICTHAIGSDCVFAGIQFGSDIYIEDNMIYYKTADIFNKSAAIRSYNIDSAKSEQIYTFDIADGGSSETFKCGYYWKRFTATGTVDALVFRINLQTSKYEELANDAPFPSAEYDGKYYFGDTDEVGIMKAVYTANIDGKGRKDILTAPNISIAFMDFIKDGIMLYCLPGEKTITDNGQEKTVTDYQKQTLYSLNLKTGESVLLIENFAKTYFAQIGKYIYYLKTVDNPPYLGFDENRKEEIFNITGGIIWRMDLTNAAEEKYIELPEYYLRGTEIEAVGNNLVINYGCWGEVTEPDGTVLKTYLLNDGGKIVINTDTYEYKNFEKKW